MQEKEQKLKDIEVNIPERFECKLDYMRKLLELLRAEAEVEKLNTEVIAEEAIKYEFKERLEIYCRIEMRIPKTNQQHIRPQVLLSVVIPIVGPNDDLEEQQYYQGFAVIKKVAIKPDDKMLTVTIQIDIENPTDRDKY